MFSSGKNLLRATSRKALRETLDFVCPKCREELTIVFDPSVAKSCECGECGEKLSISRARELSNVSAKLLAQIQLAENAKDAKNSTIARDAMDTTDVKDADAKDAKEQLDDEKEGPCITPGHQAALLRARAAKELKYPGLKKERSDLSIYSET
ncbi:MAG: hypothetical protein SGPRY_012940 [Prymnesium sp.]